MGTYTNNYNLFMPSVGETGWGDLVNGNFSTIDTTMKSLSNRITAVENEVNGNLSCTSVTTSGKITGNGGIAGTTGTFSGAVTASNIKSSITVTVSNNWFKLVNFPTNVAIEGISVTILPLTLGVTYSGKITYRTASSGYSAELVGINNSSNVAVSLGTTTNTTETTVDFSNMKAVYYFTPKCYGGTNLFKIPILS